MGRALETAQKQLVAHHGALQELQELPTQGGKGGKQVQGGRVVRAERRWVGAGGRAGMEVRL